MSCQSNESERPDPERRKHGRTAGKTQQRKPSIFKALPLRLEEIRLYFLTHNQK
jgi:hypothetical protein